MLEGGNLIPFSFGGHWMLEGGNLIPFCFGGPLDAEGVTLSLLFWGTSEQTEWLGNICTIVWLSLLPRLPWNMMVVQVGRAWYFFSCQQHQE